MEVSLVKDNIKIKGNKTIVVIDPVSKIEAQVVIFTQKKNLNLDKVEGAKLVVEGPGEYEIGGMSIVGKNLKGDIVYTIYDSSSILFLSSSSVAKVQESGEYDCVLIKVTDNINEDLFSTFDSKCYILYGDYEKLNLKSENIEKTNKVNLKKTGDISGKIFLLTA